MKLVSKIFLGLLWIGLATSCGLDNYDEPQSSLQGKVTYNGEALGVRGTSDAVQLQLYQDGYDKHDPITVYVGQDGTFKAVLFDGEYKLVTKNGNGPWVNKRDTVKVNVHGNTTCEVPVTPYYTISGATISLSGSTATASATINKVVSSASVSSILLLVSKTAFVDEGTYIARKEMENPQEGTISLALDMTSNKDFASAKYLYARIGVKAAGADQYLYSPVVQIK